MGRREPPKHGERRFRLLIVEDEYLTALSICYALENHPFEIVGVVGSAADALAAVEREFPDLVLMDIRLSGPRDGVDAALEIHRRFQIRCLFATASADMRTPERAAPSRPLGWLTKPYSDQQLLHSLTKACGDLD